MTDGKDARISRALVFEAFVVALALAAWVAGLAGRSYSYDETLRAHSLWLCSQGLQPYRDFLESHPPYFEPLSWLTAGATDPGRLLWRLRLTSAAGHLLFLLALVRMGRRFASPAWARAAVLLTALHPLVAAYLVEFRIDAWAYAFVAWAMVWILARPVPEPRPLAVGATYGFVVGFSAVALCPKVIFVPGMFVLALAVFGKEPAEDRRTRLFRFAGTVVGMVVAFAAVIGALKGTGYDLSLVKASVVDLNEAFNREASYGFGLAKALVFAPAFAIAAAVGAIIVLRRRPVDSFAIALVAGLAVQLVLVGSPFRQYVAPWLLFAAAFGGAAIETAWRGVRQAIGLTEQAAVGAWPAFAIAAGLASWTAVGMTADRSAARHADALRWMLRVAGPGESIVASPPYHPLFRRDVFYAWWNTFDPGGNDTERMGAANSILHERFQPETYRRELAASPPALVVISPPDIPTFYPPSQWAEIDRFLKERGYVGVERAGLTIAVPREAATRAEAER